MMIRSFAAALLLALPAGAYIEAALASLGELLKQSDVALKGTVDAVSLEKKVLILKAGRTVKGKTVYERIRIDLNVGEAWHAETVLRHAVVGTPVAVLYKKAENLDTAAQAMVYLNRFFFSAQGGEQIWRFAKIELGMNKVFLGTPEELADLIGRIHAGRAKAPEPVAARKPWTKETLEALPLPPKEGEPWPPYEFAK